MKLSLGFSPCPNDCFMFDAIVNHRIDLEGLEFSIRMADVEALNKRYGVVQDPAVLVLRPPGDLIVRIDGFADRDTVAQAASNAGS